MTDVLDHYVGFGAADSKALPILRHYANWRIRRTGVPFRPDSADDVDLRSYLVHLRSTTGDMDHVRRTIASLKQFHAWAEGESLIEQSPFSKFNFDRPLLSREEIRRREDTLSPDPMERELARLRGLNQLGDQLNRGADIAATLNATLRTLVETMRLTTAWAFLWSKAELPIDLQSVDPPNDFVLVESFGLPPGLEEDDFRQLRCSPRCHCQELLCAGRLVRAINVVECTRLLKTARAAGDTRGLLFHTTLPMVSRGKPVGMINVATERWELLSAADLQFLSAAGAQVGAAIERACLYDEAEGQRSRLARELEMARQVQVSLIPARMPVIPGFDIAADWRSAREVAGDFYDVFSLSGGRWAIVIGDVSGKGAPAALYMAMVRGLLRAEAERAGSPGTMLARVNRRLQEHAASRLFVTVFCGIVDPQSRSLTYSLAGHEPPLLRRSAGEIVPLTCGGLMLGPFADANPADAHVRLETGDMLVAYTDGVTEAANSQGEFFGMERLTATIGRAPREAGPLLAALLDDIGTFVGESPRSDDLTIVVLECLEGLKEG